MAVVELLQKYFRMSSNVSACVTYLERRTPETHAISSRRGMIIRFRGATRPSLYRTDQILLVSFHISKKLRWPKRAG
ncbi:hypothetical protein TNCT_331761 [Trichonephila clavata]|uniref:Uncharacterized protein n=1 Tax=Trichonephila clavata TaxID=2740835 RepID=A0A8X6FW67_TRICU|nr:hypothetical protein TNCT_331761 [Trichonephila clavata]